MSEPRSARLLLLGLAVTAAVLAVAAPSARADGDPASDYLYTQRVFLPSGASAAQERAATALAAQSDRLGAPIKVAVIGSVYDLGSITPLWRRPATYARFLGTELSYVYHGPLLIVMPNGFGLYDHRRPTATLQRALGGLQIQPGVAGLVRTAQAAIRRLAAARGHPLPNAPSPTSAPSAAAPATAGQVPATAGWVRIAVVLAGILAMAVAWTISLRIRPARRLRMPRVPEVRRPGRAFLTAVTLAALVGGAAAVAVPLHRPSAALPPAGPRARGFTWPAGARPAPEFHLRTQAGRPISLADERGHVVILAFLDPVCRNLCPLEAAVIGRIERTLGARARPRVVAVSVNPWGDGRRHLLEDIRKWNVGPAWTWAVGSHAALARVWKAYGIGVIAKTVRVAGTDVHEISHTEAIYLLDGRGGERQLYPYPFTPATVIRGIRHLEAEPA
jgi:cytochrome oxidase Cu insertion factor (SCO1/SenC/PrrC family)